MTNRTPGISQPGRNSFFENIYRTVRNVFRSNVTGSQRRLDPARSYSSSMSIRERQYDQEISEQPVRDFHKASELIGFIEHCPEASTAIEVLTEDTFSNPGGDDIGFKVGDPSEEETIDPQVEKICQDLIRDVIGGLTLEPAVERMLSYGDAFLSIGFGKKQDGSLGIAKVLFLPTWSIFRMEDNQGNLLGFQQRISLNDTNPVNFHPVQIVHFRYRKKFLYGRSLFAESLRDWNNLSRLISNHPTWVENLGNNPTIHVMPAGVNTAYKQSYREDHESKKRDGLIVDYYLMNGHDVKRMSEDAPDLGSIDSAIELYRTRIIMKSRVPIWIFAGFDTTGAREISGQPALSYSRHINWIRMCLTEGIDQLLKIELTLKGVPQEKQRFKIIFPPVFVDPLSKDEDEEENEAEGSESGSSPKKKPASTTKKAEAVSMVISGVGDGSDHAVSTLMGADEIKPLDELETAHTLEVLEEAFNLAP